MKNRGMVVDTGIFIEYLRVKNKSKTILQNLPDNAELYISSVRKYPMVKLNI